MRRLILILPAPTLAACAAGSPTATPTTTPIGSAAPSSNAGPNILPIFVS